MPATFADVAKSEYILLTTFTKDGRPKPTAIWAAPDGDRLVVITQETSWKVKRIRNTPRVTIAPCDRSGNPKGEAVEAAAAILDKSANGATYDAHRQALRADSARHSTSSPSCAAAMKNNVTIELRAV